MKKTYKVLCDINLQEDWTEVITGTHEYCNGYKDALKYCHRNIQDLVKLRYKVTEVLQQETK